MDKPSSKIKEVLLDLLFPKFCLGCQKEGSYLCEDCRSLLEINEYEYCLCDAKPQGLLVNPKTGKCSKCQNKNLSGLYFALPYKNSAITRKLVHQFKYQPWLKDLAKTLAGILVEHFILAKKNTEDIWENAVLVPIPLDKKKIKTRGYNQSEELAKELEKVLNVPVVSNVLTKMKHTEPQMTLSKLEREKNLKDAFIIKNPENISGKKIFLVDDVYTTGSTMEECARVLLASGAKNVWGIALSREG